MMRVDEIPPPPDGSAIIYSDDIPPPPDGSAIVYPDEIPPPPDGSGIVLPSTETEVQGRARVAKMRAEAGLAPIGEARDESEAWMADTPEEIKAAKSFLIRKARQQVGGSWLPNIFAISRGFGANVISRGARVGAILTGSKEMTKTADYMNRYSEAVMQAASERDIEKPGWVPPIVKRGIRGAGVSLPSSYLAGPIGPYGIAADAALTEANQAITEGKDAGLSDSDLTKYAITQGVIEGGISSIFTKVGLGGAENVIGGKVAVASGVGAALKQMGVTTLQELPEELATELTHNVARAVFTVDPNATTPEALWSTAKETTAQTLATLGFVAGPHVGKAWLQLDMPHGPAPKVDEKTRIEIGAVGYSGEAPTRAQWKEWKLDPSQGKNIRQRRDAVKAWSKEYAQEDAVAMLAEQAAAPVTEAAPVSPVAQEAAPVSPEAESQQQAIRDKISRGETLTEDEAAVMVPMRENVSPEGALKNVSMQFSVLDELRARRDLPPMPPEERNTFEGYVEAAKVEIAKNPTYTDGVIAELKENDRPASTTEGAALVLRQRDLENLLTEKSNALTEANASGDEVAIKRAQSQTNAVSTVLDDLGQVLHRTGSHRGAALNAQKLGILDDFSVSGMTMRLRNDRGGAPLTVEDNLEIAKLSKENTELRTKLENRTIDTDVDFEIEQAKPKKRLFQKTERMKAAKKNLSVAWEDFKTAMEGAKPSGSDLLKGESGALNIDVVKSGYNLAKASIEYGAVTLDEFLSQVREVAGDKYEVYKDTLAEAWKNVKNEMGIPGLTVAPDDPRALFRAARMITRSIVQSGITNREKVVAAVHREMAEIIPGITERQVKEYMTKYGVNPPLPTDKVSVTVADLTGQLLQLLKLEDMEKGKAPLATGARRVQTDAERQLVKLVNEAKKKGGYVQVDFVKQLKTALETAKTAAKNAITDLETEIKSREKIVKTQYSLVPDQELLNLQSRLNELRAIHAEIFPAKPRTDAQKVVSASAMLDRLIAQLEDDIKTGNIQPVAKNEPISTPGLEVKRARLSELRGQRDVLREAMNPRMSAEERDNLNYKNSLIRRLTEIQRKISERDFSKRETKDRTLDKESIDLLSQINSNKERFQKMRAKYQKANQPLILKGLDFMAEGFNFSRAILTSMDVSAVLRQGAMVTFAHPILALRATPEMIRAFGSRKGSLQAKLALEQRANAVLHRQSKLAITTVDGGLTHQEEQYYGSWAQKVIGVAGSERAYVTFLNRMRADVFDSMVATLGQGGEVTAQEAKIIANYVNVATGRGDFGAGNAAASVLATYFFAPRYALSRFQLVLGQPLWRGNLRMKTLIAKEYGRSLAGLGAFYGLAMLANQFSGPDDDKFTIEGDARSSDFGKVRIGNTRLDPLAGISQTTVLLTRISWGEMKTATGQIVPITGEDVPYGGMTVTDAVGKFLRNKLSPAMNLAIELRTGETTVGEPTTPIATIGRNLLPLSFRDISEAMKDQGVPKGTVLTMLILLGMGAQTYQGAGPEKFAEKITEHEKLIGRNKKTKQSYNYTDQVSQVVQQAKKLGLTEEDLRSAMISNMKSEKRSAESISEAKGRLHRRFIMY